MTHDVDVVIDPTPRTLDLFVDVAGILAVCGESLDRVYVEQWIQALDLREVWRRVPGA